MKPHISLLLSSCLLTSALASPAPGDGAPANAKVGFANIKEGEVLPPEFVVKFDLQGMKVRKASEDLFDRRTGHHHLLIDIAPVPKGQVIVFDEQHMHFGKGQTETKIKLAPGPHKLIMQLGDGAHASYGPALSATVNIVVDKAAPPQS